MPILHEELHKFCEEQKGNYWVNFFQTESVKAYFQGLDEFVSTTKKHVPVYPPQNQIFKAFTYPMQDIQVIILGQDPYHEKGQAMGLSFSVPDDCKTPPSLRNIKAELKDDLGIEKTGNDLSAWAEQGVFLLNTVLTVSDGKAASHAKKGWEIFTANAMEYLAEHVQQPFVAILWGSYAQQYKRLLVQHAKSEVLILESPHPSPLSAYRGFFGSKPFSKTNDFLIQHKPSPINWEL